MNNIRLILALAWKELQVIVKDRGSLAILFLLPILLGTVTSGANLMMNQQETASAILLKIALVNEDDGTFGTEISKAIRQIEELDVEIFGTDKLAEESVIQGEKAAAVIIPSDFSQNINTYIPTFVEVIVDPAQPESASIVSGIMNQVVAEAAIWGEVQYGIRSILEEADVLEGASAEQLRGLQAQNLGVVMTQINKMRAEPFIEVLNEDLKGAAVEGGIELFFAYVFPGFTVMFAFFVVSNAATSLLVEREAGTFRRLLAAPIPRGTIIAGKMTAYMIIPILQTVILFAIARMFFDMPLGNDPLGLIVLTAILSLCATAMGMLVAALAKTAKQASDVGVILGFVLAGIGGAIPLGPTPLTRMSGFAGVLSRLTPHGQAVEAFYRMMAENATFAQLLPEMGILLGFSVAFFLIAVWRFRFD